MFYHKKYLKYKYKYFKLLGGSGKGTYDIEKNICIPTVVNSEVQQKIYTINFLWLNRNVDISHKYQKYIFPFDNKEVTFTDIMSKIKNLKKLGNESNNLEYIKNILNIIKWSQENPTAVINIWHDSNQTMVENTRKLINILLNYDELIIEFETLFIIIDNITLFTRYLNTKKNNSQLVELEKIIEKIMCDELTNQYIEIKRNSENPKIIDSFNIKQEFMNKIFKINELIKFDGKLINFTQLPSSTKTLDNLRFESILNLDRLKHFDSNKQLVEYFGLKIDGTPSLYDKVPVYFKVDLVRLIILLQLVRKNPNSYAIYADFDTQALDEKIIFTEESIKILDTHGLVLPGSSSFIKFENSFHIIAGENLTCDNYMILSIDKILIEYNIQKIIYEYPVKPQDVFDNYKDLFTYYFIIKFDIDKINGTWSLGKLPNLAYYQRVIMFIPDLIAAYRNEEVNMDINKKNLLCLDMKQIGYLLFSKKKEITNGIFYLKDIFYSDDDFIGYFPIRFDLSEISPHHYNYDKKYLRI
jgi:hypothetical protein